LARARNIKPGFFKNADLVELTIEARLLFIGLWTLADRAGRLEDRPKQIKMELFPADAVDVDACLDGLQRWGFVARYEIDGKRLIQVVNFDKHQNPHRDEKVSVLPAQDGSFDVARCKHGASTVRAPDDNGCDTVAIGLIPDSLIPESLSTDSGNPIAELAAQPPAAPKPRRAAEAKEPAPSTATWNAYSDAYYLRYQSEPVRNAKVNGQLAQLVARLGAQEAPHVAGFFVGHNAQRYVRDMHPVGLLLQDAEKLRTEWATNRQMTSTKAQQADKTATNYGAFQSLIEEAEARERNHAQQ